MSDRIELSSLNAVSYNPRVITSEHLDNLKQSIKDYAGSIAGSEGYRLATTVTVNKNGNRIVGGHQRVKALKGLGQTWIHKDDITWVDLKPDSAEEKALNITLNSEKFSGDWDVAQLDKLLKSIHFPELVEPEIEIDTSIAQQPKKSAKKEEHAEIAAAFNDVEHVKTAPVLPKSLPTEQVQANDAASMTQVSESSPDVEGDTQERLFPLSYAVNKDQRLLILKVVNYAKSKFGFSTSSEALAKVCEEYAVM